MINIPFYNKIDLWSNLLHGFCRKALWAYRSGFAKVPLLEIVGSPLTARLMVAKGYNLFRLG